MLVLLDRVFVPYPDKSVPKPAELVQHEDRPARAGPWPSTFDEHNRRHVLHELVGPFDPEPKWVTSRPEREGAGLHNPQGGARRCPSPKSTRRQPGACSASWPVRRKSAIGSVLNDDALKREGNLQQAHVDAEIEAEKEARAAEQREQEAGRRGGAGRGEGSSATGSAPSSTPLHASMPPPMLNSAGRRPSKQTRLKRRPGCSSPPTGRSEQLTPPKTPLAANVVLPKPTQPGSSTTPTSSTPSPTRSTRRQSDAALEHRPPRPRRLAEGASPSRRCCDQGAAQRQRRAS